jgi:hypothetical protein
MNGDKHWLLDRKRVLCNVLVKNEMPIELNGVHSAMWSCVLFLASSFTALNCISGDCLDTILEKLVTQTYIAIPLS